MLGQLLFHDLPRRQTAQISRYDGMSRWTLYFVHSKSRWMNCCVFLLCPCVWQLVCVPWCPCVHIRVSVRASVSVYVCLFTCLVFLCLLLVCTHTVCAHHCECNSTHTVMLSHRVGSVFLLSFLVNPSRTSPIVVKNPNHWGYCLKLQSHKTQFPMEDGLVVVVVGAF